uniref:hypothetical protein n=1 Tax=Amycolatopsis sp. CA-096443 TaxID=3239919 RepID=UPI003F496C3C
MTRNEVPEIVVRRFPQNGCEVTAVVADPADAQQTIYGTVTRDGTLVGSFYCANQVAQTDWRIVTGRGHATTRDDRPVTLETDAEAIFALTTALTSPGDAGAQ